MCVESRGSEMMGDVCVGRESKWNAVGVASRTGAFFTRNAFKIPCGTTEAMRTNFLSSQRLGIAFLFVLFICI